MSAQPCPVRTRFAEKVLAEALQLEPGESLKLKVRFGSSEHPEVATVLYVRAADDGRCHFVRRTSGELARIHDTQVIDAEGKFSRWAEQNRFPQGRWA